MYIIVLKYLLGLTLIGTIWAVGGDTSLNSSASGDTETERTRRQRRAIEEVRNTNAQRQEFVDRHNAVRRDITKAYGKKQQLAANMMRMYWNGMLEADAIAWSKIMCRKGKMAHGQSGVTSLQQFQNALPQKTYGTVNIGQNVYQSGGEKNPTPTQVFDMWGKESVDFTYNVQDYKKTCPQDKQCGHYTQVVWHESFLVGCGGARCSDKLFFSTCNYLLAGNWPRMPYTEGQPGSLCASDESCKRFQFTESEDNLCVPKDRCSPVKECEVDDTKTCLCKESDYEDIVSRLLESAGVIHVASPVVVFGLLLLPLVVIQLGHGAQLGFDSGLQM